MILYGSNVLEENNMKKLIVRDGYVEQVWSVRYSNKMFEQRVFVRGTEPEMREYMESEFGYVGGYYACSDKELDAIDILKLKVYIAPELD